LGSDEVESQFIPDPNAPPPPPGMLNTHLNFFRVGSDTDSM
jgi:hypothetical protein